MLVCFLFVSVRLTGYTGCLQLLGIFWNLIIAPGKFTAFLLSLYNTDEENIKKNNSKISQHVHGTIIFCIASTDISHFIYASYIVWLVISLCM